MNQIISWVTLVSMIIGNLIAYRHLRYTIYGNVGRVERRENDTPVSTEKKLAPVPKQRSSSNQSVSRALSALLAGLFAPFVYVGVLFLIDTVIASLFDGVGFGRANPQFAERFLYEIPGASLLLGIDFTLERSNITSLVFILILLSIPASLGSALGMMVQESEEGTKYALIFAIIGTTSAGVGQYYLMQRVPPALIIWGLYVGLGLSSLIIGMVLHMLLSEG